jgi:hypothetical protein
MIDRQTFVHRTPDKRVKAPPPTSHRAPWLRRCPSSWLKLDASSASVSISASSRAMTGFIQTMNGIDASTMNAIAGTSALMTLVRT